MDLDDGWRWARCRVTKPGGTSTTNGVHFTGGRMRRRRRAIELAVVTYHRDRENEPFLLRRLVARFARH